ncbi:Os05g0420750 [Oryza sativa Japonica Group]|uniref:Os05g0420750 protein n=1 Tax=Oryza sativa subsp. japonica TaxID=39947 RepID=A0A0P0WMN6_ORYSJ|nr:hypothetical protein EE612_029571 [Oryza sativa]BAS94075.1 Os05g0420750 [Oryza sativa Japonica Group]
MFSRTREAKHLLYLSDTSSGVLNSEFMIRLFLSIIESVLSSELSSDSSSGVIFSAICFSNKLYILLYFSFDFLNRDQSLPSQMTCFFLSFCKRSFCRMYCFTTSAAPN